MSLRDLSFKLILTFVRKKKKTMFIRHSIVFIDRALSSAPFLLSKGVR